MKPISGVRELQWSDVLSKACKVMVDDLGPQGLYQLETRDGRDYTKVIQDIAFDEKSKGQSTDEQGQYLASIVLGQTHPLDVLSILTISDGEETRQDRMNLFFDQVKYFGCYTGHHLTYQSMTFILFQTK